MASKEVVNETSCINIDELRGMTLDEFLSHFNLNSAIKEALLKESLDNVGRLFDCDMNDIIHICKTFSSFENISIKDKVDFKQIMKQIIETIENQYTVKCKAKKLDTESSNDEKIDLLNISSLSINSNAAMPLILSEKEHLLISEMYDKLDQIIDKRKQTNESLTLLNSTYDDNMFKINSYFNELIESIKVMQSELLEEFENKVKNKKEESNNLLSKLNEFELLINKEIDLIECDWFVNKTDTSINNNDNNNNNERRLIGSMLKEYILSPKKRQLNLENSMKKIKEFENENLKEIKNENTIPSVKVLDETDELVESMADSISENIEIIDLSIMTRKDDKKEMECDDHAREPGAAPGAAPGAGASLLNQLSDSQSPVSKENVQGSFVDWGADEEPIWKTDDYYETAYNLSEIFGDERYDENEVEPYADDGNEILIFECFGRASRFDKEHDSWRKRGYGPMKLYFNQENGMIRLEFIDDAYSKVRLSQTFYSYFNFEMKRLRDKHAYAVEWHNSDYVMPQAVHGRWKIVFCLQVCSFANDNVEKSGNDYLRGKMYEFLNIVKDFYFGLGLPRWCELNCGIKVGSSKSIAYKYDRHKSENENGNENENENESGAASPAATDKLTQLNKDGNVIGNGNDKNEDELQDSKGLFSFSGMNNSNWSDIAFGKNNNGDNNNNNKKKNEATEKLIGEITFKKLYQFGYGVTGAAQWKDRAIQSKMYFYQNNENGKIRAVIRDAHTQKLRLNQIIPSLTHAEFDTTRKNFFTWKAMDTSVGNDENQDGCVETLFGIRFNDEETGKEFIDMFKNCANNNEGNEQTVEKDEKQNGGFSFNVKGSNLFDFS